MELTLADGVIYPLKGKFSFADRQVDVRTGAIRLAGLFPNPGKQPCAPANTGRCAWWRKSTSVRCWFRNAR
ncbi:MAG: hypothetical protein WDO73_16860 [Ignavibacteriota bacterium]